MRALPLTEAICDAGSTEGVIMSHRNEAGRTMIAASSPEVFGMTTPHHVTDRMVLALRMVRDLAREYVCANEVRVLKQKRRA